MRLHQALAVTRMGQRGEGVAQGPDGAVFVPYALPGDGIIAEIDGQTARLAEITRPSPDRVAAFCPSFGECGGCAIQTWAAAPYAAWKRGLVEEALRHARIEAPLAALVDAHGAGRRRATFHARILGDLQGRLRAETGFMRARSHDIVEVADCPILSPGMSGALPAARALAQALAVLEKPLDILVTETLTGLDIDLRGCGALEFGLRQKLIGLAESHDLARVANHGESIIERRAPILPMGRAEVAPPPGAFLQATLAGEEVLAGLAAAGVGGASKIADLFSGLGTFALRLAEGAEILAVEGDARL